MTVFKKVRDHISDHVELIRYFLPAKDVSVLFKILNFISCDRLRYAVVFNGIEARNVKHYIDHYLEWDEFKNGNLTPDQYVSAMEIVKFYADRANREAEGLFTI